jgi:hypothetical protein
MGLTVDMPHWIDMGPGFLPGMFAYEALFLHSERVSTVYVYGALEVLTATKNWLDITLVTAFGVE